jgi:hypothetical protein
LLRARQRDLDQTYELALAILLFDRLGYPADGPIIQTFARRLLDGQSEFGLWDYACPVRKDGSLADPPGGAPRLLPPSPIGGPAMARVPGDHSNTQFAVLGLWVAQRHGVSAQPALDLAGQYFRRVQRPDGSWTYKPSSPLHRDSMTCAGLLSLAMEHGVNAGQGRSIRPQQPVRTGDEAIARGLGFLGNSLDKMALSGDRAPRIDSWSYLYYLWSLERTAAVYDLQTIGGTEWYPWAAELLVNTQQADGRWPCSGSWPVGTCFALLVLRRSNVTQDLLVGAPTTADPAGPVILQGPDALSGVGAGPDAPPGPIILQGPAIYQGPTVQPPRGTLDKIAPRGGAGTPDPLNGYIGTPKKK